MTTPEELDALPVELSVAQTQIIDLRARVAELEAENRKLQRVPDRILGHFLAALPLDMVLKAGSSVGDLIEAIKGLAARATAAEAELARRGQGVQVKPLEWRCESKSEHRAEYFGLGWYLVLKDYDGWRWMRTIRSDLADVCKKPFDTAEAAKAAAQADYEARIRAALVSPGDGLSEYEKKVAQMKEDFPNGI